MKAMDIFRNSPDNEKINFLIDFLQHDTDFQLKVAEKYGSFKWNVGDYVLRNKLYICKVVGVRQSGYDVVMEGVFMNTYNDVNGMTSNLLHFASEEYERDWDEAFRANVNQNELSEIPKFVFKHFYHDTFNSGKVKKTITTFISFTPEYDVDNLLKIIKIPFEPTEMQSDKVIKISDIKITDDKYEVVFSMRKVKKL